MTDIKRNFRSYRGMTIRNIKVYAKDKMAILLSLLTQIIVLGLYLMFLKSNYVDIINNGLEGFKDLVSKADIEGLVNSWLISGVIGTSVVTVALNTLNLMVKDKEDKIDSDYRASSVKGSTVVMSYFSGAVASTFIISSILLSAGYIFLACTGTFCLDIPQQLLVYALTLLGSVSGTLVLMLFISFFKKSATLSSFGVMVSASIGFIVGAYVPVSQFSENVQTIVNLVPGSQIAAMMRNILVGPAIDNIDKTLDGIDKGQFAENAREMFALKLKIFGTEVDTGFMLTYSFIIIAVFAVLNIALYNIKIGKNNAGVGIVCGVIPYINPPAYCGPVFQVLHKLYIALALRVIQSMAEAALYGAEPHYNIIAGNNIFRCAPCVLISEGINGNIFIAGGLYGIGNLIYKIQHSCGLNAAVGFFKSPAFFALAVIVIIILSYGNYLQGSIRVVFFLKQSQHIFFFFFKHIRVHKAGLVCRAFPVMQGKLLRV